ncbi:TPA: LPXTG cell wall anchor domain-containing protein, partial [Enterococcus faecalis]
SRNMVINYPNSSSDNNSKRYDKSASKLLPSTGEEKMGSLIVIGIIIIFIAYLLFRVRKSQK